ncbi:hypothetical protein EIM50_13805 [Pseudoxanthomonas sp. SGD-10]|nr:hypothetical protein EIM50_13805 [Pseudoxanthomonas sp. SGD-10]
MIEGIRFSDRGDQPTDFEIRLLAQASSDSQWITIGQRLMRELGPTAGARALAIVLDELGGEKVCVTTRRRFFEALWRDQRDELIRDLARRDGWTYRDIADALGVTYRLVRAVARGCHARGRQRHGAHGIPGA